MDSLADNGPATRLDLERRSALSRATITAAVAELLGAGILTEMPAIGSTARGRPPVRLALARPAGALCAIDLGHSHIAVAVGTSPSDISTSDWRAADVDGDPAAALAVAITVASTLLEQVRDQPLRAITAVVPQPVTRTDGSLVPTPFLKSWHGLNVRARLTEAFGVPASIENDANAGALAEYDGRAKTMVYVKVSTGIGAGIVIDGTLARGSGGQAGEIGHLVVNRNGQLCGCGNRGCLETLASIPAVLRELQPVHGTLDGSSLAELLASGNTAGARAMQDAGEAIGVALAPVLAALQVDLVVIDGPPGLPMEHLVRGVRMRIDAGVHPQVTRGLTIRAGTHGRLAPLTGAMQISGRTAQAAWSTSTIPHMHPGATA